MAADESPGSRTTAERDQRAEAFARLFEAVHEGVYIATIGRTDTVTLAANPHLKLMFGYAPETAEADVRPFDRSRFVDPRARDAFLDRLATDGAVFDHLLRLRRADDTPSGSSSPRGRSGTNPAGCGSRRSCET